MLSSEVFDLNSESEIKENLIKYNKNNSTPFTTANVKNSVSNEFRTDIRSNDILRLMKNSLHLSFKWVSNWPADVDNKRIDLLMKALSMVI